VGQIDVEVAGSAAASGAGAAALAGYTFTSRRFSAGVLGRAVTARYATLSMAPEDDRELARVSAFTAVAINARAGVSAQYAFAIDRDLGPTVHVGLTGTVQILRRLTLALGLGRSYDRTDGASIDAFAGLTLALDHAVTVAVGAQQGAGVHEGYAEVDKPLPPGEGFGFRVYGEASRTPSALGTVQYQGAYGRYQATAQDGPGGPSAALDVSGAVVFVRGAGVLPTRSVQDGFAVIHVPGAPNVRGFLDNQEIGRTNGSGDMVLPALLPYYGNRVSIADVDVAMDRSVTAVERIVAPPYRGGALVTFEARRARFYRGRMRVVVAGKVVPPSYGELTVRGPAGEVTSPLGKDGELELEGLPPGRYPAEVVHEHGTCAFTIDLPPAAHAVTQLGELQCGASP
jgi:outer membrane usher protein